MGQHLKNKEKSQLELIEIVFDGEYNKSVSGFMERVKGKEISFITFKQLYNKYKEDIFHLYFDDIKIIISGKSNILS